ncbi:MAG: S9 family peptidase [bacterium]
MKNKKNININDLYNYKFLSSIEASPNGENLLFVNTIPNSETHEYDSRLYCLNTKSDKFYPLTSKGKERSGLWLNNEEVLFVSGSNKKGVTYSKLNISGGESEVAFTIMPQDEDTKVLNIKRINEDLFVITQKIKNYKEPKSNKENRAEEGVDFVVLDELPFWFNGQGLVNKIRTTISLYIPSENKFISISNSNMNVAGFTLNDSNSKLLYWGKTYTDVSPKHDEIYEYHIGSGYTKEILPAKNFSVHFAKYLNNNILFEGSTKSEHSTQTPKLYTINNNNNNISELLDLDGSLSSTSGSDITFGAGSTMKVIDNNIYCLFTSWGDSYLSKLSVSGEDNKAEFNFINQTTGTINCFDIVGEYAYCVAMRKFEPQELFKINLSTGEETKLSGFNKEFVEGYNIIKPDYFRFTTKNNVELEGWVIFPTSFNPKEDKKYPGVLSVHGGPKAVYGSNINHEMQCMASRDMFVFYTNPRGSDGRGEEFSNIAGKLGDIDFIDLMDFTDEVLKRYTHIDEDKLGITGGSYGGFICNWAIGNTDRFKVATSQRSISNYVSKCLSTDIGYYHNLSQTGSDPWTSPEKMWSHSPLKYVKNAKTPTLFIQSDEDYRCWMSEPLQMFSALCQLGVPSKIALFHGENHELSRSGKLKNRINRLEEILGWLDKYLN